MCYHIVRTLSLSILFTLVVSRKAFDLLVLRLPFDSQLVISCSYFLLLIPTSDKVLLSIIDVMAFLWWYSWSFVVPCVGMTGFMSDCCPLYSLVFVYIHCNRVPTLPKQILKSLNFAHYSSKSEKTYNLLKRMKNIEFLRQNIEFSKCNCSNYFLKTFHSIYFPVPKKWWCNHYFDLEKSHFKNMVHPHFCHFCVKEFMFME